MTPNISKKALGLIRKDQTGEAIDLLFRHISVRQPLQWISLHLLAARVHRLKRQMFNGTVAPFHASFQTERNRINFFVLLWIRWFPPPKNQFWRRIQQVLAILVFLGTSALWLTQNNQESSLLAGSIRHEEGQLVIPFYRTELAPNLVNFYFSLKSSDQGISLISKKTSILHVEGAISQGLLIDDEGEWTRRQGVKVHLPKPGRYEFRIPITSQKTLGSAFTSKRLAIEDGKTLDLLSTPQIRWYQYTYFGTWPYLFKSIVLLSTMFLLLLWIQNRSQLGKASLQLT